MFFCLFVFVCFLLALVLCACVIACVLCVNFVTVNGCMIVCMVTPLCMSICLFLLLSLYLIHRWGVVQQQVLPATTESFAGQLLVHLLLPPGTQQLQAHVLGVASLACDGAAWPRRDLQRPGKQPTGAPAAGGQEPPSGAGQPQPAGSRGRTPQPRGGEHSCIRNCITVDELDPAILGRQSLCACKFVCFQVWGLESVFESMLLSMCIREIAALKN